METKAVLIGPCIGEMYWEFARFAPYIIWKRINQYLDVNIRFIVLTRPEMFDVYTRCASTFVPLNIPGDGTMYKPNCFRLDDFPREAYDFIIRSFKDQYSKEYKILEHVRPDISKKQFLNKNQFPKDKLLFDYKTRPENLKALEINLSNDKKPIVVLAPRYRSGMKRNWPYWQKLYDMIFENKNLTDKYKFIICGKNPDYVPDKYKRFVDINDLNNNSQMSLIGVTIETIKKAKLTIGSQSAIPNISLLLNVPVLEWGHQKFLHTIEYNPFKTKVTFIEDMNYNIKAEKVYSEILKLL
jgi:hypothetical protein